jgi:serine/threonine protein kinase
MLTPTEAEDVAKQVCAAKGLSFKRSSGVGQYKYTFMVEDSSGRQLALKVHKAMGVTTERQRREIDAMRRCNHPCVGGLISVERIGNLVISTEAFLGGGTLTERLANGLLTRDETLRLGEALIGAIEHFHSLGLVHRDIKPDNIMFRGPAEPVIVDLGLVRNLAQLSVTQTWADRGPGTPFFAPPEQLRNEKQMIDWRSDQFSLGVVLTIAASGSHPYATSVDAVETVTNVDSRKKPSPAFEAWAAAQRLPCLPQMVSRWTVGRFRTPDQLRNAWLAQR